MRGFVQAEIDRTRQQKRSDMAASVGEKKKEANSGICSSGPRSLFSLSPCLGSVFFSFQSLPSPRSLYFFFS